MTLRRQAILFVMLAVATVKLDGGEPLDNAATAPISTHVHAFYYGWFGSPEVDGQYVQWNHAVIDKSGKQFPGGDDIGANFYPQAGCYSANDSKTLDRQMKEMRSAGIGVLVASWWAGTHSPIGICPNCSTRPGSTASRSRSTSSPGKAAMPKTPGRPSCILSIDMGSILHGICRMSSAADRCSTSTPLTGSPLVTGHKFSLRKEAKRFAGLSTILWSSACGSFPGTGLSSKRRASTAFTPISVAKGIASDRPWLNGPRCRSLLSNTICSSSPASRQVYSDTRIRPWNDEFTRPRKHGEYYDWMFAAALDAPASWVSITSYNEWHEGTQIEPSVSKRVGDYAYEDFTPDPPDFYLQRTRVWIDRLDQGRGQE